MPGLDLNAMAGYGPVTFLGEYVGGLKSFDPQDLSYNGGGANPKALDVEGIYTYYLHGHPGTIGVGYDWTAEALGLLLPKQRYLAEVSYSPWQDTLAEIEFRHDQSYAPSDRASGAGSAVFGPQYRQINMVTGDFSVYF